MLINKYKMDIIMFLTTILGTLIYTFGILWFLDSNGLYSSGLIGMSQLIVNITEQYDINIPMDLGLINLLLNIPLIMLAFNKLSRRFAIYSTISIVIQTIIITFSPGGIGDVSSYEWINTSSFIGASGDAITNAGALMAAAVIGGLFTGAGTGLALKFGSSTAGVDIYAQHYSLKNDKSVGTVFLVFNGIIILIAFILLSPILALFTLIRQIVATITLDKLHTSYNYLKLEIVSKLSEEIAIEILKTGRGVTKTKVSGAYTNNESHKLTVACSSYEMPEMLRIVYSIDAVAFTTTHNIDRINGSFNRTVMGQSKKNK